MSGILNFLSYLSQGKKADNLPTLTLAEYVVLAAKLPPPTDRQKENFVKFVSHALQTAARDWTPSWARLCAQSVAAGCGKQPHG